jgi:branched-chain amino acid transport system permease protein
MTIIGGTGNLFGSVLGAGFYLIVSDVLSELWPRWLLLLGALLIALALFMQGGIWGLIERAAKAARGGRGSPAAAAAEGGR